MKYIAQLLAIEGDVQHGYSATGDIAQELEFECNDPEDIETHFKFVAIDHGIKLPAITTVKMENGAGPYWYVAHTINGANQQLPIAQIVEEK